MEEMPDHQGASDPDCATVSLRQSISGVLNPHVTQYGGWTPPRVLHVGDVAGVAHSLCRAVQDHSEWSAARLPLPDTFALRGRVLRTVGLASRSARIPLLARQAASRLDPSVVHLHWARFGPLVSLRKHPLVVHAHGSDVRGRMAGFGGRLVMQSLDRADAVLAATPDLLEFLPPEATYCPNPIDLAFFAPEATAARLSTHRQTVLLFAKLTDLKGGRQLIAVARELKQRRGDLDVLAFRGGTFDSEAAAAGVRMLEPTNRDGVRRALLASDVVIGQLRLGVLGLSELEAMACSRPVIAPITPGHFPEALPIVTAVDPDEIAERCLDLLDDDALRLRIGGDGRRYVETHHSPDVVATLLTTVYDGLL